jgi:patatin-like phospholipase/acyl hydrolase
MNTENKTVIQLNASALEHLLETLGEDFQVAVTAAALNRASKDYIKNIANNNGLSNAVTELVESKLKETIGGSFIQSFSHRQFKWNEEFKKQVDHFAQSKMAELSTEFRSIVNQELTSAFDLAVQDKQDMVASLTKEYVTELLSNNKDIIQQFIKQAVRESVDAAIKDKVTEFVLMEMKRRSASHG